MSETVARMLAQCDGLGFKDVTDAHQADCLFFRPPQIVKGGMNRRYRPASGRLVQIPLSADSFVSKAALQAQVSGVAYSLGCFRKEQKQQDVGRRLHKGGLGTPGIEELHLLLQHPKSLSFLRT
jgi:hypothetical protein